MTIETQIAAAVAEQLAEPLETISAKLVELAEAVARPAPEPLIDRKAAAAWAGCCPRTVDSWIAEGCPVVRLGGPGGDPRFKASELHGWLRTRTGGDRG